MKKLFPLILLLILSASLFAQAKRNASAVKIASVDTMLFEDNPNGIKRLLQAIAIVNAIEYFEVGDLSNRIVKTKREIDSLLADKKPINEKYSELKELERQFAEIETGKKAEIARKNSLVVTPVINKIKEKYAEFALKKGYAILIDRTYDTVLIEGDIEDVTTEFIKFCNDAFDKEQSEMRP